MTDIENIIVNQTSDSAQELTEKKKKQGNPKNKMKINQKDQ